MTRVAWVLNFAAEEALGRPPAPLAAARALAHAEATGLLAPGDRLVTAETTPAEVAGAAGRAWIPDGWARARLASLGVGLEPALPEGVLRRVLSRRFSHDLGATLPGERWVEDVEAVRELASRGGAWVAKRALSCAGRGRRLLRGAPSDADLRWVDRSLALGGLLVEPWVERTFDCALHGFASERGLELGRPTVLHNGPLGAWERSAPAAPGELLPEEERALAEEVERAGRALLAAGYRGPFGVDAFRWRDGAAARFRPRCEINARYSMGWALGMAGRRPDRGPYCDATFSVDTPRMDRR